MAKQKIKLSQYAKQEYNVTKAFKDLEQHLLNEIMSNLSEYTLNSAGGDVNRWAVRQLKMLEDYILSNKQLFDREFSGLTNQAGNLIREMRKAGANAEEIRILQAVRKGYQLRKVQDIGIIEALNKPKLDALINATMRDMDSAKTAILRKSHDEYRNIIYNAQVGLNTGTLSYTEAIDKSAKSLIDNGINCIRYKDGSVHKVSDYCDMALKTADKRAYLMGEGEKRSEYGLHLVLVGQRGGDPCECCLPYVGEILVDDVYSGGTVEEAREGGYTLLSEAIADGLYHPRCKDSHTTYFPGITEIPKRLSKEDISEIKDRRNERIKEAYKNRQIERNTRRVRYTLDKNKKMQYKAKLDSLK